MSTPDLGINADLNGAIAFSTASEWNQRVDLTPLLANSASIISQIAPDTALHADFGSGKFNGGKIGIPYIVVPEDQKLVKFIKTLYRDEGDNGPFPIPKNAPIEFDSDHHVIIVQRDDDAPNGLGKLIEIYKAKFDGKWKGFAAVFDLQGGDHQRPDGWTSADAAGLPIFPGLTRFDDVENAVDENGTLGHALRFTLTQAHTAMDYLGAASHTADSIDGAAPFGLHLRLRADFQMPQGASPEVQVIINTLKMYGMILADNGSDWFISGTPDKRWDNEALRVLSEVKGGDFEAVDNSKIGVVFEGGAGNDVLSGNEKDNQVTGKDGDDRLNGGAGSDVLAGGSGKDVFVFDSKTGTDTVTDFETGLDSIYLDTSAFAGLGAAGRPDSAVFHAGSTAADTADRIIYDSATGTLAFDPDGTGSEAAIIIANLQPGTVLSSTDFVIV
jgi:hypothetical protein